jgi:hypothetical protein
MTTRRSFIKQTAAASIAATTSVRTLLAAEDKGSGAKALKVSRSRQGSLPRIKSLVHREETTLRLGGHGAEWHISWAADDRQFVSLGGGMGWSDNPERVYISRILAISDGPQNATFQDISGYPDHLQSSRDENTPPPYICFGTIALDGRTWCNQDGLTPVTSEGWDSRSRKSMLFFEEPQNTFSLLSVLQMGRNYEANRDGYVYIYACNGNTEGTMNQLVLCRVPKGRIVDRLAYEFFSGLRSDGSANWTKDINARGVVHTFPSGWVNTTGVPHAWQPSVAYNAPLGLYIMANWGNGIAPDGAGFAKPCYIGFWTAPNPWGPWTQIHEGPPGLPATIPDRVPTCR